LNPLKFLFLSEKDPTIKANTKRVIHSEIQAQLKRIQALNQSSLQEAEIEKLNGMYPANIAVLNEMGLIYSKNLKHEKALRSYQQALNLPQDTADKVICYLHIGLCFFRLKNYPESIKAHETAIKLNKNAVFSYNGLGDNYFALGDFVKSKEYFLKYYHLEEYRQAFVAHQLALIELELANFDSSIRYGKDAIKIEPENSDRYFNVVSIYWLSKKENDLYEFLEMASKKFPHELRFEREFARLKDLWITGQCFCRLGEGSPTILKTCI